MSDLVEDSRARIAWRGALVATLFNALGSPFELVLAREIPDMPRWPPLAASVVGLVLFTLLLRGRHRPTRQGAAIVFLVNTATVVAMLCIDNAHWATLGPRWAPFQANKLGALTVALLTPEIPVGLVSILAYAGGAVGQWALLSPELRAQIAHGEPLVTCIYAGFGVAILVVATRRFAIERRLIEKQHQTAALERLARALMAVRDIANTPLQTIESATALARMLHPDAVLQLQRIERALDRLRELNQLLSRHESHIHWQPGDESFDAVARLEDVTSETKRA